MGRRTLWEACAGLVAGAVLGVGLHLWLSPAGASAPAGEVAVAGIAVERPGGAHDAARRVAVGAVVRVEASSCGERLQGSATLVRDGTGRERLLTNAHVVRGARRVQVVLADGTRIDAAVRGSLVGKDAAVLDAGAVVDAGGAPAETGGRAEVGDVVVVAGHPRGSFTIEGAAVADVQRRAGWGSASEVLLVGARAHGGHSGGAVLDTSGLVVGLIAARDPGTGRVVAYRIGELLSAQVGPPPGC